MNRNHFEYDEAIERLVDKLTASELIGRIAVVCREKADYVSAGGSHGDPSPAMARQWHSVADSLEKAADKAADL